MADLFSKLQFSNLQKNPKRLQKFVEKLKKRYPGGDFDVYHSENRAADDR